MPKTPNSFLTSNNFFRLLHFVILNALWLSCVAVPVSIPPSYSTRMQCSLCWCFFIFSGKWCPWRLRVRAEGSIGAQGCTGRGVDGNASLYMVMVGLLACGWCPMWVQFQISPSTVTSTSKLVLPVLVSCEENNRAKSPARTLGLDCAIACAFNSDSRCLRFKTRWLGNWCE